MEGGLEDMDSSSTGELKDAPQCKCPCEHCEARNDCGFCSLQFFRGFSISLLRWRNIMEVHLRTALNLRRHEVVSMFVSTLSSLTFLLIVSLLNISYGAQKSCQSNNTSCGEREETEDINAKVDDQDFQSDATLFRNAVTKGSGEISGSSNSCGSCRSIWDDIFIHNATETNDAVESHQGRNHPKLCGQRNVDTSKINEFDQVEKDDTADDNFMAPHEDDGDEDVDWKNDQNDLIFSENDQECLNGSCYDAKDSSDDSEGENVNDTSMQCDDDDIWSDEDLISTHLKGFPPPISILANETHPGLPEHMSRTFWRSVKRGGRFVLQELQAQPNEFFLATRNNGRLRLELVRADFDLSEDSVSEMSHDAEESLEVDLDSDSVVHDEKLVEGGRIEDVSSGETEDLTIDNEKAVEECERKESCNGQIEDVMHHQTPDDYMSMDSMTRCEVLIAPLPGASEFDGKLKDGNVLCGNMPCEKTTKSISEDISIPGIKESQSSLKVELDRYSCSKAMIQACT